MMMYEKVKVEKKVQKLKVYKGLSRFDEEYTELLLVISGIPLAFSSKYSIKISNCSSFAVTGFSSTNDVFPVAMEDSVTLTHTHYY